MTLRFGYSIDDIERLSRLAARSARATSADWADRVDTAWHGIVEALYSAAEKPSERDLLEAGWTLVEREIEKSRREHGRQTAYSQVGPRFARYWHVPPGDDFVTKIVDRYATRNVLWRLDERDRHVLMAYAECGCDLPATARAIGFAERTTKKMLQKARAEFSQVWHDGETAPPLPSRDVAVAVIEDRQCGYCGETFGAKSNRARYCSDKCRNYAGLKRAAA